MFFTKYAKTPIIQNNAISTYMVNNSNLRFLLGFESFSNLRKVVTSASIYITSANIVKHLKTLTISILLCVCCVNLSLFGVTQKHLILPRDSFSLVKKSKKLQIQK